MRERIRSYMMGNNYLSYITSVEDPVKQEEVLDFNMQAVEEPRGTSEFLSLEK